MKRLVLLCASLLATAVFAQNSTAAGTATAPWPTLTNLSISWPISGDDDVDGVVSVRFRRAGTTTWRSAMPLRRVPAGVTPEGFAWGNRHAGSIFDLAPGTTYELELTLVDPDGGNATRTLTATTRTVPQAAATGRVRPVTPSTISSALSSLLPGDILVLSDGSYPALTVNADGTAALPIVLRAANPLGAVIGGGLTLSTRKHIIVEGLRINGRVLMNSSEYMTLRRNHIVVVGTDGVRSNQTPKAHFIVDNVIEGSTPWTEAALGVDGQNIGEGIVVTGPGHVICWNKVRGFRDGISLTEGSDASDQQSIDICHNDIEIGADDGIEADFSNGNVRLIRNRIRNSFMGISGQPTLGGPLYAIRNEMQNIILSPFKLHRGSQGDVALHNTIFKAGDAFTISATVPYGHAYFRNNLFIGGTGGGTYNGYGIGTGRVMSLGYLEANSSLDYDGFGSIGTGTFQGNFRGTSFSSLAAMKTVSTEAHAVQVDLSIFQTPPQYFSTPFPERAAVDLRLAQSGAAVDKGLVIANVNDGFAGAGPDLGAFESGSSAPSYGPRPQCGDGVRLSTEQCDDGNRTSGDGCSATCTVETPGVDAGTPTPDAGSSTPDAGTAKPDAGTSTPDAGTSTPDAGTDAGTAPKPDAGAPGADTLAPTVTILSPSNGAAVKQGMAVSIRATDNVGVARLQLYADGALVRTQTFSPPPLAVTSTLSWSAPSRGLHTLEARAFDAAGNQRLSTRVTVDVYGRIAKVLAATAEAFILLDPEQAAGEEVHVTEAIAEPAFANGEFPAESVEAEAEAEQWAAEPSSEGDIVGGCSQTATGLSPLMAGLMIALARRRRS